MATGSGTGTPATTSNTITLATLRARVRTQLENATGSPDPLPVKTSSATLTTLRDRVELTLQDSSNARWATGDIDEAITKALEEYNRHSPALTVSTLTVSTAGREQSISTLTNLIRVQKVWWPYTSTSPDYPPNWCQFDVYPGSILMIDEPTEPAIGDKIRVWYTTPATLNGLSGAGATTIPEDDITYLINGAAYYAAYQRAMELAEQLTVDDDVVQHLLKWSEEQGTTFRYGIRKDQPAWQRYAYAFQNDDIDEGIRWALGRFNELAPQETVTSLTLSSAGREVSLSSITDLLRVTRVWWPYTSTSPEFPPAWVSFETWDTTLFVDHPSEPQSGDVVRVWYVRLCTINGLDGASATTLPADAETVIVTGAVGYVAEERIVEQTAERQIPRRFKEWSTARLADFERGLHGYARRAGSLAASIARMNELDRWSDRDDDDNW